MTAMTYHGGACCGRRHLYNFNYNNDFQQRHDQIQRTHGDRTNLVTEVVLTTRQLPANRRLIEEAGYRKVAEWRNSNSGNVCHMFLHGNDVRWGDDAIYTGNKVRVKRSGREGVVVGKTEKGVQIQYDNGQRRTVQKSSLVNISEKI